ncbi:hypothetical protein QFC19_007618 [Naganishia cerealis]|uniref:Uncharacterized protein n=1 Tax=Naganishia cerealis TaxID=610337 RepID=A0ACC2V874_9TREE|nr:hypothetical protein QFC19_007618 [Naganishia cerealis]
MPRLQILQHKSYHPYLESNKQRVRDDEAKAAALEAEEERTALSENSTTRLEHLRNPTRIAAPSTTFREAGTDASALLAAHRSEKIKAERREEKKRLEYDWPRNEEKRRKRERDSQADSSSRQSERKQNSTTASGHINFWEGMEKVSHALAISFATDVIPDLTLF